MKELWLPINGYEGLYSISSLGRVKSFDRVLITRGGGTYVKKGRILKGAFTTKGYMFVTLAVNKRNKIHSIHRMVAAAFIENPQKLPQVNHKDGVKTNNKADNLEWCDNNYNQRHAIENGLNNQAKGENCGTSKFTEKTVLDIRAMYATNKYSKSEIGRIFGISKSNTIHIINRKGWEHI